MCAEMEGTVRARVVDALREDTPARTLMRWSRVQYGSDCAKRAGRLSFQPRVHFGVSASDTTLLPIPKSLSSLACYMGFVSGGCNVQRAPSPRRTCILRSTILPRCPKTSASTQSQGAQSSLGVRRFAERARGQQRATQQGSAATFDNMKRRRGDLRRVLRLAQARGRRPTPVRGGPGGAPMAAR